MITSYRSSLLFTRALLHCATLAFSIYTLAKKHNMRKPIIFRKMKSKGENEFDIERYFPAMNGNFEEYRYSIYEDTPEIQRAIYTHQHPSNCGRARFLIFELYCTCLLFLLDEFFSLTFGLGGITGLGLII